MNSRGNLKTDRHIGNFLWRDDYFMEQYPGHKTSSSLHRDVFIDTSGLLYLDSILVFTRSKKAFCNIRIKSDMIVLDRRYVGLITCKKTHNSILMSKDMNLL